MILERLFTVAWGLVVAAYCVAGYPLAYAMARLGAVSAGVLSGRTTPRPDEKAAIDVPSAWEAMAFVNDIARKHGARVFPISGTLLGLYRHGTLLAHDYDVDLGLFADDPAFHSFLGELTKHPRVRIGKEVRLGRAAARLNPWAKKLPDGVILYKLDIGNPGSTGQSPSRIDVFVHAEDNGFVIHGSKRSLWLNRPFALRTLNFNGVELLIPGDQEAYLAENYGDFRTEKKSFESGLDCPNVANVFTLAAAGEINKLLVKSELSAGADAARLAMAKARRKEFLRHLLGLLRRRSPEAIRPVMSVPAGAANKPGLALP